MIIEIMNKTECDNILRKLLKEWLVARKFTGEFAIFYPNTPDDSLKIELYYDENNSEKLTKKLSKELCELKK
jgi:hypothetical protein